MAPRGREGRGELKKVLHGEAPPRGPALYPIYILSKGRPRAGEELKKVVYGEDPPKVQPLTFIYTTSDRKGYPFRIPYYRKSTMRFINAILTLI